MIEKYAWGILWRSENRIDGVTEQLIYDPRTRTAKVFFDRDDARAYVREKYGYIRTRKDLRSEPHGWRMPQVVKVRLTSEVA